jgi:CheY-like chemotaxis protein
MPEQDGFETMRAMRRLHPNARIIAISGRFPELLQAAEHLGADARLAKPFRAEELFAVIGRALAHQ